MPSPTLTEILALLQKLDARLAEIEKWAKDRTIPPDQKAS